MALFKSHVLTQASGSVAGLTYAHGRSGLVMRNRTYPVNTNTRFQTITRNVFTRLVNEWTEVLTSAQRRAWETYAANVPITNPLGDSRATSGQNWFIAANTARLQAFQPTGGLFNIVATAPTLFDRGTWHDITFTADTAFGLVIDFDVTDAFNADAQSGLIIYMGRPQNASRREHPRSWRFVDVISNGQVTPYQVSPATLADANYYLAIGQAVSIRCVQSLSDGRISSPRTFGPVLTI